MSQDHVLFEKNNSKYNRIWEQLTNLSIFFTGTLLTYFAAFYAVVSDGAIFNDSQKVVWFNKMSMAYGLILITIIISVVYLMIHLWRARTELQGLFKKWNLAYP